MITMTTQVSVRNISGKAITDFMLDCTDEAYQAWWKEVHFAFHTIRRFPDDLGNIVFFDELVGTKRLKFSAMVIEAIPGRTLVWQLKSGVKLPGWLILKLTDTQDGVEISHTLKLGYQGLGRKLDPLIRLFLSEGFEKALTEHVQIEFSKLAQILS